MADAVAAGSSSSSLEMESLVIPIISGNEKNLFIEIFPYELKKAPVTSLIDVLQKECPPIVSNAGTTTTTIVAAGGGENHVSGMELWTDTALMYMREKAKRESLAILEHAPTVDSNNNPVKDVRLLASTGIALLASHNETQEVQARADQKFTQASAINTFYPMTWMGRGMLNLSTGRPDQAKFFFQTTLKECGNVLPALLGMAAVLHRENNFVAAQQKYGEIIRRYPIESGAMARVGFGLACYRLGQVDRAKVAFRRALDLDPENVDALVGTAVLDMACGTTANDEQAIKQMSIANLLDHKNAMVQNHLANYYFWKWMSVTGTVTATQSSDIIVAAQPMSLDIGDPVQLGTSFTARIVDIIEDHDEDGGEDLAAVVPLTGSSYRLDKVWKDPTSRGLKVWKKDYERSFALAKGASISTTMPEIQAESYFFMARVFHVRDELDRAYQHYDKACRQSPTLAPARFGLAQVLIMKGKYKDAIGHLTTLVSNNQTSDAFALLGLLEVKMGKIDEGLVHLRKAIDLDPSNSDLVVLEALALQQHKSNYAKSLECYKKAFDLIKKRRGPAAVPYELYANAGVLCHETKLYDEARQMYRSAIDALEGIDQAKQPALENVGVDGVRITHADNGYFFGYVASGVRAIVVGTTEIKLVDDPPPVTALPFAVGDTLQLGDSSFTTEVDSITDKDGVIFVTITTPYDPMIENNNQMADDAIEIIELRVQRENKVLDMPEATTIAFNIARLHEASGNVLAAIELHKAIAKRNPTYVNSYLRLACIAVDCGALNECAQWLKIAAATAPNNSEVLTLIGNLHLSLCDWKPAQKVFEGLMNSKNAESVTAYALLSMGNIYFANLRTVEKRYGKNLQYASDYYRRILEKDPLNAYAANGIGTVLAERGEIFKAKEIFNRVREVSGDSLSDALLNQGHIFLSQKKHSEAIKLYQSYMTRAEDVATPVTSKSRTDDVVDVLQFIAFAYFDWARHTELCNDANAAPADGLYKEAMKHLQIAIDKNSKRDIVLRFNLCMTKLQAANCVLQKVTRHIPRTVEEVEEAHNGLEESYAIVEKILKDKEGGEKVVIKSSFLENFLKLCKENLASARTHLQDDRQREEAARDERELRRQAAEMAQHEAKLREALEKQEEAKRQHERDLRAEKNMRKAEELASGWRMDTEVEKSEKSAKGKKGRPPPPTDDFIEEDKNLFESDSDNNDEEVASPKPKGRSATKKPASELFRDGKKAAAEAKGIVQGLFDSDSDDDDDDDDDNAGKKKAASPSSQPAGNSENPASAQDLFGESEDESSDEELIPGSKRPADDEDDDEDEAPAKKAKTE